MEDPDLRQAVKRDPRGFLAERRNACIIDEVQRLPDLLSYMQQIVDEDPRPGRFILTGSANFQLLESVSQSLAGRTAMLTLLPMSTGELRGFGRPAISLWETLLRGGYPALHDRDLSPREWYGSYVSTYLERDVRQILRVGELGRYQDFLGLAAGRTATLLNRSALAADLGVASNTVEAWLAVLQASFLLQRLPSLHANPRKRLVKAPKLHWLDSGMVCYLLGIESAEQLARHPLRGAVFESWVASEILKIRQHAGLAPRLSHFRDRKGRGVDLVLEGADAWIAVEVKSGQTVHPEFFRAFDVLESLLDKDPIISRMERVLVYGGDAARKQSGIRVLPWREMDRQDWNAG